MNIHTTFGMHSGWTGDKLVTVFGQLQHYTIKCHLPKNTINIDLFVYTEGKEKIWMEQCSLASSYNKSASILR